MPLRMSDRNLAEIADQLSKSFQDLNYEVFRPAELLRELPGNAIIVEIFLLRFWFFSAFVFIEALNEKSLNPC